MPTNGAYGLVSGTVKVEGAAAQRDVLVVSAAKQGLARTVVGNATSDPTTGEYEATLTGFTDPVYVICMDRPGALWEAGTAHIIGDRVYPSATGHTGLIYEATISGTSGASEPTWPTTIGDTVSDNGTTWLAVEHFQSQVHGPVIPAIFGVPDDISENGKTYAWVSSSEQLGAQINTFANVLDSGDEIYRQAITPAEIVVGPDTWVYTRTLNGALWYDEYTDTSDATGKRYLAVDGAEISAHFPLRLNLVNGGFTDGLTGWTDTLNTFVLRVGASTPEAIIGDSYIMAGPHGTARTEQVIDFADIGLPASVIAGETLRCKYARSSWSDSDMGQLTLVVRNAGNTALATAQDTLASVSPGKTWSLRHLDLAAPAGGVKVQIQLYGQRYAGTANNAHFDDIQLWLI